MRSLVKFNVTLLSCSLIFLAGSWGAQVEGAVDAITSVVAGTNGSPPYDLQSVTVGSYTEVRDNLRTGTTTAEPGGNDGGNFFGTWLPPFDTPAPNDNFDLNDILARNQNPDNPIVVRSFGGLTTWMDTNGSDPDFFIFEASAGGGVADNDVRIQAILPGGGLGNEVAFANSLDWGSTGLNKVDFPNGGQIINGISFAITDLLDDTGAALTNSSLIEGIQIASAGLDPGNVSAVMLGLEPLSLTVNTSTGEAAIANGNEIWPLTESFFSYTIESPAGGLKTGDADWNSLDDQGIDGGGNPIGDYNENGTVDAADYTVWRDNLGAPAGTLPNDGDGGEISEAQYDTWKANFGLTGGGVEPGNGWDESGGSSSSLLRELRLTGDSSLAPDESFSLGTPYDTTIADMNLSFSYQLPTGASIEGLVEYITPGSAAAVGVPEPSSLCLVLVLMFAASLRRYRAAILAVACCGPLFLTSDTLATEIHRYTFNDGTADDSVGTAHGVLLNPEGISRFAAGQLNLTGNHGVFNSQISSGQDYNLSSSRGAYVDLPNSTISQSVDGVPDGTPGNEIGGASFEMWYTVDTNRNSARLFHFGNQNGGVEDSATANTGGPDTSDIGLEPQASSGGVPRLRFQSRYDQGLEQVDFPNGQSPVGVQTHVVVTLDHDDTAGGNINGTAKVYVDGSLAVTGPIFGDPAVGIFLDEFRDAGDNNNWLGRSMFSFNPLFDGAINEFRIHDIPLTGAEVTASFGAGPTLAGTLLAPNLTVNRDTGEVALVNPEASAFEVTSYSISSPAGVFDPTTWSSIADGDGTWTESSATSLLLSESETGAGSAGNLAPDTPLSLGTPFVRTPYEDLLFEYTLSDGTAGSGFVLYSGSQLDRSDLDGDGDIDRDDWAQFLMHNATDLSGLTLVEVYRRGDLDFDGDNDLDDFLIFRGDFIAANGAPAFARLSQAVPEPSSLMLTVLALAGLGRRRRC